MNKRARSYVKMLAWIGGGAVIGLALGYMVKSVEKADWLREMAYTVYAAYLSRAWIIQLAVFLVCAGLALFYYLRAEKEIKRGTDEAEDKAERHQTYMLMANETGLILGLVLLGLALHQLNEQHMFSLAVMLATVIVYGVFSILSVNQIKRINPKQKGDPSDLNFQKDWVGSMDEAERMIAYKASYRTLIRMKKAVLIAAVIALIGNMTFGTGIFPILLTGALGLLQSLTYMRATMDTKCED